MRIADKEDEARKNDVKMGEHRHLRTAGRIDHGGEAQAGLLCDELPGELKDHESQTQHHADGRADDDLLDNSQQTDGGQRFDVGGWCHYRRQHAGDGQHQDHTRPHRQCAGAEHRRRHDESADAQERPQPLRE